MEQIETLDFEEKPKKKTHILLKIFIGLLILIIVLLIAGYFAFMNLTSAVSNKSEIINFTVEEGSSVYGIGEKLEKEGIIKNFLAYKIIVKIKGINEYKAGIYRLDKSLSTMDIIELLTGDYYSQNDIQITFKEGNNISSVVKIISENTNITETEIYQKLNDETYINLLIDKYWFLTDDIKNKDIYYPLEGYLYPETYRIDKNASIEDIIEVMLEQTNKVLSKYKSQIDSSSYSIHELITLASIVEKEGIYKDDRKGIASVFYNRLKTGMPLGSDVTTYYAFKVDLSERDLTKVELNTYNPYNTRGPKMEGKLPVGAISNFGETSFDAVINPVDSSYYYFVADKNGKTYFTKTYTEHQAKVSEIKKSGNWIEW